MLPLKVELGDIAEFSSFIHINVVGDATEQIPDEGTKLEPRGFIFIINKKEYGERAVWKLVSEHGERGETPHKAAQRGLNEEINIWLPLERFRYEGKWLARQRNHWKCLFTVTVHERELAGMGSTHPGNEGEVPKLFSVTELLEVVRERRFMYTHLKKLIKFGLILPGPDFKPRS